MTVILIAIIFISGVIAYLLLNQQPSQSFGFKAAIVDQLSGTFPNPSFNDNAKTILVSAGYTVDYYGPDQVTVDFFRNLPSKGYGLVIIRAHSTGWARFGDPVAIFTSEPYSRDKYMLEQLSDSVSSGLLANNQAYFVVTSNFVRKSMQGEFPKSIIVMMGCTGLITSEMAQAFVARGASVYISWDNSVTVDRTDEATTALLHSLASGKNVEEAVNAAMSKVGTDPVFSSHLGFYPEDQVGLMLNFPTVQMPTLTAQATLEIFIRRRVS